MKINKIKQIIKEEIQNLQEQTFGLTWNYPEFDPSDSGTFHVYDGCGFQAPLTGAGNNMNNGIPNQPYHGFNFQIAETSTTYYRNFLLGPSTTNEYLYTPEEIANNNNVLHMVWGNLNPGNVIKTYTCPPGAQNCQAACIQYVGTTSMPTVDPGTVYTYGSSQNLNSVLGTYASCADCQQGAELTYGCMDSNAENWNIGATEDDGSCIYTDTDGDGIPDYQEIEGCTDIDASNYNLEATDDDGSCYYNPGCTDPLALNYNEEYDYDNGSCDYWESYMGLSFCCDPNAENYGHDEQGISVNGTLSWPVLGPGHGGTFVDTYLMLGGYPQGDFSMCNNSICGDPIIDPEEKSIDVKEPQIDPQVDRMKKLAGIKPEKK